MEFYHIKNCPFSNLFMPYYERMKEKRREKKSNEEAYLKGKGDKRNYLKIFRIIYHRIFLCFDRSSTLGGPNQLKLTAIAQYFNFWGLSRNHLLKNSFNIKATLSIGQLHLSRLRK